MKVTIEEARLQKAELEGIILSAVESYEVKTGVIVNQINVRRPYWLGIDSGDIEISVSATF